ncbi:MMPL family transporter [Tuwongella immobilis]|uniref:SSD domain-containing protein n=1 Tax=Tuwongella immobilis TaxID=692036 RepID=A0A6C2YSZ3_9BACT|nr:MMPL family transporter [Tuwongella immobilis]VIP04501.1 mmpl domain protein : Putative RND superfamily drug exporter OS=Singulisphaera acidiphila (strain ATCC BAA-1392 / DSM 18658 / VKM B-2454 / MOB10) GN=Sinac_6480 PE=4 SV=1: MMPL: MMPL [Tuwongella immobilis]VTS06364.1 mmpl domain protein : Putative RND superfamily drug exporter OS=Singulisphaera acidiphila (strain ATCC BAA-1392 / DSM 18658 / VKM B-2454 / MOB10) GN=Sinac_6480 PE=4 SV=1: MMPL: MMPL [Tuwongella immobilis]
MFDFLGRVAVRHPWLVLLFWIAAGIGLTKVAPNWERNSHDDDIRFLPAEFPSVRAHLLMEQAFPKDVSAARAIIAIERPEGKLQPSDFAWVDRLTERLTTVKQEHPEWNITGITSYRDGPVGSRLTSHDGTCTLVQVLLSTPYLAVKTRDTVEHVQTEVQSLLKDVSNPPNVLITGPAGIGRDMVKASAASLDHTTLATIILVVSVLLIVYRSPVMAFIPLITIGLAVWVSLEVLAIVTLIPGVHLVNISQIFAIVILFGAGTDYCLFLISRYREELEAGQTAPFSLNASVSAVGGALAASAGTVMCGLGMMGFAEFGKIRCAGPVIALALGIGLLASLTITPALLRILGRGAFWPLKVHPVMPGRARGGFWNRMSTVVVRRPVMVLALCLMGLVPLAILGGQVVPSFRPIGELSPQSESVRGLALLQEHFTAGETGPLTILLAADRPWSSPEGRELITHLSLGMAHLDNVAEVRSLTQPLGPNGFATADPSPPTPQAASPLGMFQSKLFDLEAVKEKAIRLVAEKHYLSTAEVNGQTKHLTRLDVVFQSDPFDAKSVETFKQIEIWMEKLLPIRTALVGDVHTECFGVTVHTRDMAKLVARDRLRVNALVVAGVFLILIVVVKRIWLAAYLMGTVLLSYYATLGLTMLFASALQGEWMQTIEWRVPFFLFTILVAVGEDYNILLVHRILQEREKYGLIEGVRRGLAATGGTITACGIIMAGTFGTLMLASLNTLMQIGFALAVGVILDTFVVRPFLVPAFLVLVGRDAARYERTRQPLPVVRPIVPPIRQAG